MANGCKMEKTVQELQAKVEPVLFVMQRRWQKIEEPMTQVRILLSQRYVPVNAKKITRIMMAVV